MGPPFAAYEAPIWCIWRPHMVQMGQRQVGVGKLKVKEGFSFQSITFCLFTSQARLRPSRHRPCHGGKEGARAASAITFKKKKHNSFCHIM